MGKLRATASLGGWIVLCFVPAIIGGFFMPGQWYASINKPAWTPPGWLFGPVWSLLYAMMGLAAWLVWRRGGFAVQKLPLGLFLLQLFLNALWSPLFFGLHNPGLALVEIILLWLAIGATIFAFHRARPLAAWLLVPYWGWVSFATLLNLAIWNLNR
jgi:translocator protein